MSAPKNLAKEIEQIRNEFRVGFLSDDGSQRRSNVDHDQTGQPYSGRSQKSGGGSTARWFTTFRKAISSKSEIIRSRGWSSKSGQYPFRPRGRSESKDIGELVLLSNSQDSQFSDTIQSAFSENSQNMPVSPITTVTVPQSLMTDSIPKLQIEDYIAPQSGLQLSTISYEGQSDDEAGGDLNDILDQLKQMDEYFSNVDVSHVGAKLLDREDLDFLCNASIACPHVPTFHNIFSNFSAVMPEPKQVPVERDIEQEENEVLADLLKEATAQLSGDDEEYEGEEGVMDEDVKSDENMDAQSTHTPERPSVELENESPSPTLSLEKEKIDDHDDDDKPKPSDSIARQDTEADDDTGLNNGEEENEVESLIPEKPSEAAVTVQGTLDNNTSTQVEPSVPDDHVDNRLAETPSKQQQEVSTTPESPVHMSAATPVVNDDMTQQEVVTESTTTEVPSPEVSAEQAPLDTPEPPKETTVPPQPERSTPRIAEEIKHEMPLLRPPEPSTITQEEPTPSEKLATGPPTSTEDNTVVQDVSEAQIAEKEKAGLQSDAVGPVSEAEAKTLSVPPYNDEHVTPKALSIQSSPPTKDNSDAANEAKPSEAEPLEKEITSGTVPIASKIPLSREEDGKTVSINNEATLADGPPVAADKRMTDTLSSKAEALSEGAMDQSEVASVEEAMPESNRSYGQTVVRIPVFESPSPTSASNMICGSVLGSVQSSYCLSSPRWSPSLVGPDGFNQTCSRVRLECNQDVRALWLVGAQFESMLGQMLSSNASLRGQAFLPLQQSDMRRLAIKMSVELGGLVERGEESPSADGRRMEDSTEKAHAYARRHSAPALSLAVKDWARDVYCANLQGKPTAAAFNRPVRTLREIRDWAENYEADRRWEWNKNRLRHSTSRESSASYTPLEKVRLRQGERQARLGRDAYHEEIERRFQAQLEAVRARMRRAAAKKGKTLPNPAQQTIREIVYESKGTAAARKSSLTGTKISTVKPNDQLTAPAQPVPPKRHQLPPRTTPNAPTISAAPPEQTTDFRHVLRRTGRLEALRAGRLNAPVEKQEAPTQPAKAILVHKAIKPSDARDMFERKAREQAKSGEAPSEWFLKQVSKYQKV